MADIEQRIKVKIDEIGIPLKDWDILINRGIVTGFNEAFIISGEKKNDLITKDPKSAELIRPYNLRRTFQAGEEHVYDHGNPQHLYD